MMGSTWRRVSWRPAFEPAADEAIGVGGDADFQSGGAAIVGERGAVLAGQAEQALNAADGDHALLAVHLLGQTAPMCGPTLPQRASSCCGGAGRLRGRSSSGMR